MLSIDSMLFCNIAAQLTKVEFMLYFAYLPGRVFGLEFGTLLFSIREPIITMAASLLDFVVIIIHFLSESVECVRSIPLNLGPFCSEGSSSEYIISESMLKMKIIASL